MRSGIASTVWAPTWSRDPLELVEARVDQRVGGLRRSRPRCGASPSRCCGRPRITKLPICPLAMAVRAAAQLVAVALDPDGADALAVLLVEEGVGAGVDRLLHRHVADDDGPILADDPPDLGLDLALLLVGQRPVEREVEAQILGRDARAGLAGAARRRRCAARDAAGACRCGCASCGRAGRDPPRPVTVSPTRRRPWSVPRWTMRPPDGRCVSATLNRIEPPPSSRISPWSPIWPPPSGVERRPVEDDLGLAAEPVSSAYSMPSRRIATTRPSAVVVS